jgi:predicted ferric reductase
MMKYLKNNLAVVLIVILAAMPLILWFFMLPLAGRFSSSGTTFRSLGQLTGLLGMAMLSINFLLTSRLKFLDKLFSGLNKVYIKHHTIGATAFCLLLFHPVFLIVQYLLISLKSAYNFILPGDASIDFGKAALIVFIVLMVITFYTSFKYQNWKKSHQFLGIVLILAILHMLRVPSDVSNNALLRYYMAGLATLGIASYLYRTILGIYKIGEHKYKLKEVVKINDNIVELKLAPLFGKIKFLPGQFVFLRFDQLAQAGNSGALSESHPFSITSSPDNDTLSLGVKALGDYTSMVYLLKPEAICKVEGPFGVFSYIRAKSKKQIWLAGGIGITPFLSMTRHIDASGEKAHDYKIDLYYSVKDQNEAAFAKELIEISGRNGNFKFHQHFSDKAGYISADSVVTGNNASDAEIFLCGPGAFMQNLREQFVKLGFSNEKIHSEEFSL